MKTVLHVGCGNEKIHPYFKDYKEIRYDIDEACVPDICGNIVRIDCASLSFDAVYCSHNLEHVYEHEVPKVLKEFHRVLKDDGECVIIVPDLQKIAYHITNGDLDAVVYTSPAGPIRVCDMVYGYSPYIAQGNQFMAHKFGFTKKTLGILLNKAGFTGHLTQQEYDLIATVRKQ